RTADLVRMDADAVDSLAIRATPASGEIENLRAFADLATPVRLRIWRRLAIDAGASPGELSHAHTLALDGLLQAPGGKRVELPGHVTAVREGDRVHFVPRTPDV